MLYRNFYTREDQDQEYEEIAKMSFNGASGSSKMPKWILNIVHNLKQACHQPKPPLSEAELEAKKQDMARRAVRKTFLRIGR